MQVFTVPPAAMPSAIHGGNGVSSNYLVGTMIQSQPINLATTNASACRAPAPDSFERVDGFRHDSANSLTLNTTARNVNQQNHEQQVRKTAQDLSIHSQPQPPPQQQQQHQQQMNPVQVKLDHGAVNNNTLLDFCNIILNYTNYPDAFHEDYKPITLGTKGKVKTNTTRGKMDLDTGMPRPPQKRKIGNPGTTIKQKPGRKPKVAKISNIPATTPVGGSGGPAAGAALRAEAISTSSHNENGIQGSNKLEESRVGGRRRERKVSSPLNSVGESREGTHSSSCSTSSHTEERDSQGSNLFYPDDDRDESWDQVTCFCGKPFHGRPMIECENCFVWHHMSCAKLRKTNVPKKFYCRDCKHMFPDFVQEPRPRRASGNNNNNNNGPSSEPLTSYGKSPLKSSKNGLSSAATSPEVMTPLSLAIPPPSLHPSSVTDHEPNSPKISPPMPSLHLSSPTEGSNASQSPSGGKAGSPPPTGPLTPTQPKNRQQQTYLNGSVGTNKPVQNSSHAGSGKGSSESHVSLSSRKSGEKMAKRRPTLNSASSGLYDDVVLALKIN